jgi:hypothetical protein
MRHILRRLRGALGMGLLWAFGGALVGGLIEGILNILPGSDMWLGVDMWPAALAIPGFLAGVAFSGVLALAEGRRGFDELRLPRVALWGALGGVLLGGIFGLPLVALAVLALTSAASAAGTLALARRGAPRELVSGAGKEIDSGRA